MNAALFLVPVTKKNRETYSKTLLMNASKVKNFRKDASDTNYTLFYYLTRELDREKVIEFKAAKTVAQFDALLREQETEAAIPLYVTKKGSTFNQKKVVNRIEYIPIDTWVWAWDNSDGITATLIVEQGAFELVELQVNHTITQIFHRASASASFSEIGI